MGVEVLDFDLAAPFPEFAGKDFREAARTVPTSRSLANSELLPNINRSRVVCSSPRQAG
ncbi:hypothetical protein [Streptomyces clavifer]|uniref:hypothetical protein n=1 Tax=Streptomyces clavifer TaxID=68188 RepID=UPI003656E044